MAANTDKLRKKKSLFTATLSSGISAVDTTMTLSSTSGLATDTAITLTIDRVDANGTSTPSARERVTGVVSGSTLTNMVRGEDGDGGTGKTHSAGAVIEDIWEADTWNDVIDAILVGHNQDGTHDFTTVYDSNGNETLKLGVTASAVNEVTITNAATGNGPTISATGGDSNIGLNFQAKGTGVFGFKSTSDVAAEIRLFEDTDNGSNYVGLKAGSIASNITFVLPTADGSANQVLKTDGSGNLGWANPTSTDGWTAITDTLTYASATSFTIAGVDRTTTYTAGTRIKLTQTSTKYFVVTSSSFSTDTTVNVTGGSDYTVANAAITSPYYSYQVNPQGFPGWFNATFTPTNFTLGSGTAVYRFRMTGKRVDCSLKVTLSSSTVSGQLTVALPVTSASTNYHADATALGNSFLRDAGTQLYGAVVQWKTTTTVVFRPYKVDATYATLITDTSSTVPFTWTDNDQFGGEWSYEAA